VDGGSSAALLIDWLRRMGHGATLYVPDRIDEGYGPNEPAMAKLAETHDLIVCVDCGTLSHGPIAAAKGADVIVLDHHLAEAAARLRRRGEPQPAGRGRRARPSLRGGGGVPAAGRPQPPSRAEGRRAPT
jgi:hypothetical protein